MNTILRFEIYLKIAISLIYNNVRNCQLYFLTTFLCIYKSIGTYLIFRRERTKRINTGNATETNRTAI